MMDDIAALAARLRDKGRPHPARTWAGENVTVVGSLDCSKAAELLVAWQAEIERGAEMIAGLWNRIAALEAQRAADLATMAGMERAIDHLKRSTRGGDDG